ncbi:isocitrate lyase/PEP mutase family protein [Bradyrhizobium manausense]|uniref:isocitrate lyase/PEP mutase family protein n=1 Tax=Bradyrhizobium manausense TaxID=989370 RepID=UPI001BA52EAF|nr:isocitrate lyase/PEP mutase family protein [Bradyrhizobium manausense]MBR0828634.1 isocitrate lyase/PEP mutase family protein [Bradyrhizobium manausense]
MAQSEMIRAPGVYDGITAKLAEQAGFRALYMTGAGTSMARGFPDFGLLTLTEMATNAAMISRATNLPVIADADTGYGNELNVTRTVQEYERGGVAGLHIEDQLAPKRCGHLEGKELVPRDEFTAKIRAALAARHDPDFVIIARTDARAVLGLDEAVLRANAALAVGADVAFIEAAATMDEVRDIPKLVNGPCLLNIVVAGKTPDIGLAEAQAMGYRIAIMPSMLLSTVMNACDAVLEQVRETDRPVSSAGQASVSARFARFGADEWSALRTKYRSEGINHDQSVPVTKTN